MGQYHQVVNMDKGFFYSPQSLGNGDKLLEQGMSFNSTAALALLLAEGWNGERVFLVGDYVEENDINGVDNAVKFYQEDMDSYKNVGWLARKVLKENTGVELVKDSFKIKGMDGNTTTLHNYHSKVVSDLEFVEDDHGDFIAQGSALDHLDDNEVMAFVNYDTKEKYVGAGRTMRQIVQYFGGDVMTAAFILIAGSVKGGARGGGDPYDKELAGTWAGDRVGIIPDKDAQDFVDITMDLGTIKNL